MSRAGWLNTVQAILAGLQVVNVGAGPAGVHFPPIVSLILAAVFATGQVMTHVGALNTEPPAK